MKKIKSYISQIKKSILNTSYLNENLQTSIKHQVQRQHLNELMLKSCESGISEELISDNEVVVSLTTYGLRINTVFLAIESIFQQTLKANQVVLYISEKQFNSDNIPISLKKQEQRGLKIRYVKDIGPYTKLLYAIKGHPDNIIITIDDDYIYPSDTIEKLVRAHSNNPKAICCHHSRIITKKDSHNLNRYESFPMTFKAEDSISSNYLAEGFGGVLYPPHSLHDDLFNEELFMKLSPHADDLWFKAMELLNRTPVLQIARNKSWIYEMSRIESVQDTGLLNINVIGSKNDSQLKALFDYYHLYELIP